MTIFSKAASRGFATQIIAWGLFYIFDLEIARVLVKPGFEVAKMAGDQLALAAILAVNWLLFSSVWLAILAVMHSFHPEPMRPVKIRVGSNHGYYEM